MARRKRDRKPRSTARRPAFSPATPPRETLPDEAPTADRWRPWLLGGLCALLVARPLFPSESAAWYGDGLLVVMLWIALAVFWLLGAIGGRAFHLRFGWTDAGVLLLVGLHTTAALWATIQGSPRPALNMLWEWIAYGLGFLLARQLIAGRRQAKAVVAIMVALGVALAGYGLYQYLWELPAARAEYFQDPDAALRKAGVWYEPGSRDRELFQARLDTFKPIATFALTNSLAGYLAPWLVVTIGIGASTGLRRTRWPTWRTWLAVAAGAVPMTACLLLTSSRTGCLAAAFGVLLLLIWSWPARWLRIGWKWPAAIVALGAVFVASVVLVGGLEARLFSAASRSLGYRIQYWQSTWQMIADYPVLGCGPGNFQDTYTRYMLPEASEEIADPHNFLMEVWATAGTPAMLALLGVLGGFAWAVLKHRPAAAELGVGAKPGARQAELDRATRRIPSAVATEGDAPWFVLGGAACGFLLAAAIGPILKISSAPPGMAAVVIGLPLAACATALLYPWIDRGKLPPVLPAIGLVVLLVNLSAAGAMGFPGVAGSFWLLLALGLNLTDASRAQALPRSAALAGLGVMMALLIGCWASAFNPVLRSQAAMHLAQQDLPHAEEHLKDAAAADPLAAEPYRRLAALASDRWLRHRVPEAFDEFETWIHSALKLAPRSASTWQMCGDRYREAFVAAGHTETLPKAISAYARAVELYPSSAVLRASLALVLRASGDEADFRQQAAVALRLDSQTPHLDKKLDDRLRYELRKAVSRSSSRDE